MRLQLKALFILVAIAAGICAWLVQRRTPIFGGALIQIVDPRQPSGAVPNRNSEFENAFYTLLIEKLANEHPEIVVGPDPAIGIREAIQLQSVGESSNTALYAVNAWGNTLTSDRERLKTMMKTAVDVLFTLSQDRSRESKIKILNVPNL